MTLNIADYTADPKAWYVTRTAFEPAPREGGAVASWRMKSRVGGMPLRLRSEAYAEAEAEVGRAQGEGYRFADFGLRDPATHYRPVFLEKPGQYDHLNRRLEIDVVNGRERQAQMDDDLADRFDGIHTAGAEGFGMAWLGMNHECVVWAQEAGLDVTTPFMKLKISHLAWDRCAEVDAVLQRKLRAETVAAFAAQEASEGHQDGPGGA